MRRRLWDPDSRINKGIGNVGEEISQQGKHGAYKEDAHDGRIIAGHDGHVKKLTHARYGKNSLENNAAADEARNGKAKYGNEGQQSVPQGVFVNYQSLA